MRFCEVTPRLAVPDPVVLSQDIAHTIFREIFRQHFAVDQDREFRVRAVLIRFRPVDLIDSSACLVFGGY